MTMSRPSPCLAVLVSTLALGEADAIGRLESGNAVYRVSITDPTSIRTEQVGFYGALTGPEHPISQRLRFPGELMGAARDSIVPLEWTHDTSYTSLRSYDSLSDYTLGDQWHVPVRWFSIAEPPFSCQSANTLAAPQFETITVGGVERGVRASWDLVNGTDDLQVIESVIANGDTWIDGSVRVTLTVVNRSSEPRRVGLRHAWGLVVTRMVGGFPAGLPTRWMTPIPPNQMPARFAGPETEWWNPSFHSWLAFPQEEPRPDGLNYWHYCASSPGVRELDPPPTPPELIQIGRTGGVADLFATGGGISDRCFRYELPSPPRPLNPGLVQVATTWGATEATALVIPPGGEVSVTQYLMVFDEPPLTVATNGPLEATCTGGAITADLLGQVELADATRARVITRWSSPDPFVTFTSPDSLATQVVVPGVGTWPVELTAAVGAYQATAETTVTVTDTEPPAFVLLEADPATLWPPNHRYVPVHVRALVEDACDPSPTIRLVAARSSEPDDGGPLGDGFTLRDIQGASYGQADFDVLLRAERGGRGPGRTYTLTYEAADASGNATRQSVEVLVPHDGRRRRR